MTLTQQMELDVNQTVLTHYLSTIAKEEVLPILIIAILYAEMVK